MRISPDIDLGPLLRSQIDGDERAEAGLHIGDEETRTSRGRDDSAAKRRKAAVA